MYLMIAGSPSHPSRNVLLLEAAAAHLRGKGAAVAQIIVRDLPPTALLHARFDDPDIVAAHTQVAAARGLIISTPVYKAAYTGILKAYLDVLPPNALAGKAVLPLVTGAGPAHMLALDYALKPVLAALGAGVLLPGLYLMDAQVRSPKEDGPDLFKDADAQAKFYAAVDALHAAAG
jgi:FMN reductase